jgi:hypothetical protein
MKTGEGTMTSNEKGFELKYDSSDMLCRATFPGKKLLTMMSVSHSVICDEDAYTPENLEVTVDDCDINIRF